MIISKTSLTFGASCLAFPFAVKSVGLITSLILFFTAAILNYYSNHILVKSAIQRKKLNYVELINVSLGRKFIWILDLNYIILYFAAIMSYQKFIFYFASDILEAYFQIDKNNNLYKILTILFCFLFIQIPLCLLREIKYIQNISICGLFTLAYAIIVILIKVYTNYNISIQTYKIIYFEEISLDIINTLLIFIFGFASHPGILNLLRNLNRPSKNRFPKVVIRGFIIEFIIYFSLSFGGYFSFLGATKDNILSNFPLDDKFIMVAKISLFICLHCTIAINYNVVKLAYQSIFLKPGEKTFSFCKNFFFSFITLFLCNVFVYYTKNIITIIGLIAGISLILLGYTFPILIYLSTNNHSRFSIYNLFAYIVLIFTSILGMLSFGYNLYSFINSLNKN
jgi:amino acid permease